MSIKETMRGLILKNREKTKSRQVTLLTRAAHEVGVTEINYWGHIQGKIQPTFRNNYAPSHAAMS